jgi:hypothetical protein
MGRKQESEGAAFSLRTKDATQGGGIEGALATIQEIGFIDKFTYGGRQKDNPQAALRVVYAVDGMDRPWEQNHTLGPAEKYEVIADGYGIRSAGKQSGLNSKCSAFAFFTALEAAAEESGVDIDEIVPDEGGVFTVEPLEGRRVTLTNIKFETVGGDKKDLPVIASFITEDTKPGKSNGKANGKSGGKQLAISVDEKLDNAIVALLEEAPSIKKAKLSDLVFQANRKDADVKAMMNLTFKDTWLADETRPFNYDRKKGVLTAKDAE